MLWPPRHSLLRGWGPGKSGEEPRPVLGENAYGLLETRGCNPFFNALHICGYTRHYVAFVGI